MIKTYRKIATIKAKLFGPGDEDGLSCIPLISMCIFKDDDGKYKQCHKCKLNIDKKPFIKTLESQMHFGDWYKNYICTGIEDEHWLVAKDIFEKTYEEI